MCFYGHCEVCCYWQRNARFPQAEDWATCELTTSTEEERAIRGAQAFAQAIGETEAVLITHKDFGCYQYRNKWEKECT